MSTYHVPVLFFGRIFDTEEEYRDVVRLSNPAQRFRPIRSCYRERILMRWLNIVRTVGAYCVASPPWTRIMSWTANYTQTGLLPRERSSCVQLVPLGCGNHSCIGRNHSSARGHHHARVAAPFQFDARVR